MLNKVTQLERQLKCIVLIRVRRLRLVGHCVRDRGMKWKTLVLWEPTKESQVVGGRD